MAGIFPKLEYVEGQVKSSPDYRIGLPRNGQSRWEYLVPNINYSYTTPANGGYDVIVTFFSSMNIWVSPELITPAMIPTTNNPYIGAVRQNPPCLYMKEGDPFYIVVLDDGYVTMNFFSAGDNFQNVL